MKFVITAVAVTAGSPRRGLGFRGRDGAVRAAAITLAVALAALTMGTGSARAADRAEVGAMIDVATTYFGDHCVAGITVAWVVPRGLDGPDVPGGHAIGRGAGCRIWLDTGYFDSVSWAGACAVVVHEAGHALGYGHSTNPASVMQSPAPAMFAPCEGRLAVWRWNAGWCGSGVAVRHGPLGRTGSGGGAPGERRGSTTPACGSTVG